MLRHLFSVTVLLALVGCQGPEYVDEGEETFEEETASVAQAQKKGDDAPKVSQGMKDCSKKCQDGYFDCVSDPVLGAPDSDVCIDAADACARGCERRHGSRASSDQEFEVNTDTVTEHEPSREAATSGGPNGTALSP